MPKKSTREAAATQPSRLRIGAVSRLTKIPVDTLRAWERRYGVVAPNREASAVRLYDQDDVERLVRIKRLVDRGHSIGSVANLSHVELEAMLALHGGLTQAHTREQVDATTVVCYGASAPPMDTAQALLDGVTVLGQYASWTEFEGAVMKEAPGALVIVVAALMPESVDQILRLVWRSAPLRAIVCYGFSPAASVSRVEAEGVIALRSPVSRSQIMRELRRLSTQPFDRQRVARSVPEPRLFDDATLVELAKLSTSVECECPHHLVGIIRTLNDFEFYSANCEHRHADDASLHAMLRIATAQARALMERALIEVAELEDLPLPQTLRTARLNEGVAS